MTCHEPNASWSKTWSSGPNWTFMLRRCRPPKRSPPEIALALVHVLRPGQWIKNTACLAGLIFSGQFFNGPAQLGALAAFAMFCMAASAVYIINDLCDRENDRRNPRKAHRPIAAGILPAGPAVAACLALLACSGLLAWSLGLPCARVLALYLAMNLAYSFWLKHAVLVDVLVIATGFVFRVLTGVYAVQAQPTAWIVLCMFFLALLLGFGKRRAELAALKEQAAAHRPVLVKYSLPYIDVLLAIMAAVTVVCYTIYTVESPHKNVTLIVTVPPVVYGIARYLLLVLIREGEGVEKMLVRDRGLLAAVLLWTGLCMAVLYGNLHLFDA